MKMITEHLGEIIVALVIFALLCTLVFALRGPMDRFFNNVTERIVSTESNDGTAGEPDDSGWVTETEKPAITYKVKYNANGGEGEMGISSHTYGVIQQLSANVFVYDGYTFAGWSLSEDGSVVYADKASVKDLASSEGVTVELFAIWRANTYTVHFDANGGEGTLHNVSFVCNQPGTLPENTFVREGYSFDGWNRKADGSGDSYDDKAEIENLVTSGTITLYAQWVVADYEIEFNLDGGKLPDGTITAYTTEEEFTLPVPTRSGYTFTGWTGDNGDEPEMEAIIPEGSTGDKSYTANWSIITYTITYHTNEGVLGDDAVKSYDVTTATFNLPTPTRSGYTFGGWFESVDFDDAALTQITKGTTGDKTYYAKWLLDAEQKQLVGYSYNGVVLPGLPEWDKTVYPYALIVYYPTEGNCSLFVFGEKGYYNPTYNAHGTTTWEVIQFPSNISQLEYWDNYTTPGQFDLANTYEIDIVSLVQTPGDSYLLWSNYDIPNKDGSLYFKASEPVPVYE